MNDWVSSGNYRIYSCSSQASEVQNLLDLTYLYVQTALLSTNTPAYKAFFRSADSAPVKTVLGAITAGTNVTTGQHGPKRPTLVCVNAIDPGITAFWDLCKNPSQPMVIQPPETPGVFLCPVFFERALSPQTTDCGIVNHAQTRMITHSYIAGTQYGFLTQALADMYIREMVPGVTALSAKARDENECLALPPDQAVRSSSSYAFFLSSEWQLLYNQSFGTLRRNKVLTRVHQTQTCELGAQTFHPGCQFNEIESYWKWMVLEAATERVS